VAGIDDPRMMEALGQWLRTPEAQRFLMGREDGDAARPVGRRDGPRTRMLEELMAAGRANPDFERGGGGSQFMGRWPENPHGDRFVGGPPNTQRTDPGGAAWQGIMDPYNEYGGAGSMFTSPPYPHPDFKGVRPRPAGQHALSYQAARVGALEADRAMIDFARRAGEMQQMRRPI
jgi:hypothetical protein